MMSIKPGWMSVVAAAVFVLLVGGVAALRRRPLRRRPAPRLVVA